ncbi:MAG: hypothetical protein ACLQQ4_00215 [Bacteroidia bacterium]
MQSKNYIFLIAFALFFGLGNLAKSQEHQVTYEDGTVLYYNMVDTTAEQMHHVHLNIFSMVELSYFRPDKKYWINVTADWLNGWYGVQGYYMFSEQTKNKEINAQAKEVGGGNSITVYPIHIHTQKSIFYAFHGGLMMVGSALVEGAPPLVPEISVGIARIKAWGVKFMIKDPAAKKRSLYTIIAQRTGTVNLDLMAYPVKPSSLEASEKYNVIGERIYVKGFIPFLSGKDFGMFGMLGIQNGVYGLGPLIGFGFCGGWK